MAAPFGMPSKDEMLQEHRYQNARHAVIKSYEMAKDATSSENRNQVGDKWEYTDKPHAQYVADMASLAKLLANEMTKDLNETLKVLEEVKDGDEKSKAVNS